MSIEAQYVPVAPVPQPFAAPHPGPQYVMVPVRQRNGLGAFGFGLALLGFLVPTGIVSLLALTMCLVAVGRAPRALAGIGVALGLIGSALWLIIDMVILAAGVLVAVAALAFAAGAFALTNPEVVEITSDMVNVTIAAKHHEKEHGRLPESLAALGLGVATVTDPWGNGYRYLPADDDGGGDGPAAGFDLISAGLDGRFDTDDDVRLSQLDRTWEDALEGFESRAGELFARLEALDDGELAMSWEEHARNRHRRRGSERPDGTVSRAGRYESAARAEVLKEGRHESR